MSFAPVRLDGGGCCQVHALSPDRTKMVGGSDTQGYYLTTTSPLGNKWSVQNTGIGVSSFWRQCAALIFSSTETSPQVVYAATGEHGNTGSGGLLAGTFDTNGNIEWAMRSTVPQFAGNQVTADIPNNGWQRSTGRLLYQDSLFLFAGTYKQGILRSSNTGGAGADNFPVACQMNGAAPGSGNWFCMCVVPDPASSTTLWAGFFDSTGTGAGLWKCTNAHAGTPNFVQVATSGAPAVVEDIVGIGDYLYVAAANQGVYRYGPLSGTPAWAALNGASVDTAASNWWNTVNGYVDGSANHVVIIGDSNPTTLSKTLMQLTVPSNYPTGSITYANLTGSVQVTNVPTAAASYSWWAPAAGLHNFLGGSGYICPFVTVDASNLAAVKLYCAGSGGCYRNVGSGWTVANSGMPMFLAHPVAANPVRAGHVVWGDSDWCLFDDTNPGAENATTLANDPPVKSTEGWAVAVSDDGNTVYGSQGAKYTNAGGQMWSRPWDQPSNWSSMGLGTHTGGKVAIGLAAFTDNLGAQIVLAAVWGSGLWRWDGTAWTSRNATIAASGSAGNQIPVTYYGNGLAFVFDRKTGIWRSTDYGKTWTLVWNKTTNDKLSGTVAYDVTRPGRLWVSAAGNLYQLSGADTGTVAGGNVGGSGRTVNPPGVTSAGPVATDKLGNIVLASQDDGAGSGLWQTGNDGVTWADITGGDGSFARCNCNPEFLAIGPVEPAAGVPRYYVSGSNVVTQGFPASGGAPPGTSAAFTEVQASSNTIATGGVLPVWFNQTGGKASVRGSMLSARLETTDGSATITPQDPNWQLAFDQPAQAGTGTARVQIWHYFNNPGGIAGPGIAQNFSKPNVGAPSPAKSGGSGTRYVSGGTVTQLPGQVQAPQVIVGTIVPANPVVFTSSNTSATFKGKLFEYSTPTGTVQFLDQTGGAGAQASATSLPVTATAANTFTGGLAVVANAANWSVAGTGQSWTTPAGWTSDGSVNNLTLTFSTYYQTGITAGPASVTGTINPGSGGTMAAWAAAVATYYATAATPVAITTTSLSNGTVGTVYNAAIVASGGATPYLWALTSGTLPGGLSFGTDGTITGTPTTPGLFSFAVTVTDSAGQTSTSSFVINVVTSLSVATTTLPSGGVGSPYFQGLTAAGGSAPYTWAMITGGLPPGLALTGGNGPPAGTIAGVPLLPGVFTFTVKVTDRLGAQATAVLTITVVTGVLQITTTSLPPGKLGQPYSAQFTATGGSGTYTWSLVSGALPAGLTLSSDGSITGTLQAAGHFSFTVQVTG